MPDKNYVVVGAPVDQPRCVLVVPDVGTPEIQDLDGNTLTQLHPDPSLAAVLGSGPLTVESIGKLMVHMSEHPDVSDEIAENRVKIVKAALAFLPKQGQFSDAQRDAILEATEVQIVYETREKVQGTDRNVRILVVPSDHTLAAGEAEILQGLTGPEGDPPLAYPLDRYLMLSARRQQIEAIIRGYFQKPGVSDDVLAIEDDLIAYVDAEIENAILTKTPSGDVDPDDIKNQILTTPVRAFHRAVGIYATNMCR